MKKRFKAASKFNKEADVTYIEGDVFKKIKSLPDESMNLIISSPPYNLNKSYEEKKAFHIYLYEMEELLEEIKRVLKKKWSSVLASWQSLNKNWRCIRDNSS